MNKGIFAEHAPSYLNAGYEPRPIKPKDKACKSKGWNKPNSELPAGTWERWLEKFPDYGVGLRLGTILADGSQLCVLDIDDDRYVKAAQFLLGNPPCGRIGSKGIAYFVRLRGVLGTVRKTFDVPLENGKKLHVGELLVAGSLIVIPPTIHPDIQCPYRWIGKPLLEVDPHDLPIVEV